MISPTNLDRLWRLLRKPPSVIIERIALELRAESDRFVAPRIARGMGQRQLCKALGVSSMPLLREQLAGRPSLGILGRNGGETLEAVQSEILHRAGRAMDGRVDLLGSGEVVLGQPVDWFRDYKTGHRWPARFHRDIEYANLDLPSDVKFPWELSRFQWLIPAGQAYQFSSDERYAATVRDVVDSWIAANPYAMSVNWSCTMDVALRAIVWTWFFHVFHASAEWTDDFMARFLCSLYQHGLFIERNLEKSDVNGNHYTADAAGLVFVGFFFGEGRAPQRWSELGWRILEEEIRKQVSEDGVDFEGSVPYHRLVTELFLLPAMCRMRHGLPVSAEYRQRLLDMAWFVAAYSRTDGSVPLLGDADDARVLPFGTQALQDHRYLIAIIGAQFDDERLLSRFSGPVDEVLWLNGPEAVARLGARTQSLSVSTSFPAGGYYVMTNEMDHVFVDCAPVGLAGRGGHGHNDCLSLEARLSGVHLLSDAGAYLYTASMTERNLFRSTAYHNTPQVDGEEINRFIRPDYLWNLHYDAKPTVHRWEPGGDHDLLEASHSGYLRLEDPVLVRRTIRLFHREHRLVIEDEFECSGEHDLRVGYLFAPGVEVSSPEAGELILAAAGRQFRMRWSDPSWRGEIEPARISPSYGVVLPAWRLALTRRGGPVSLLVSMQPIHSPEGSV